MENEFDEGNFCVKCTSLRDVTKLENILRAIRPADHEFMMESPQSAKENPYFGVLEGMLVMSEAAFAKEYKLSELAVAIIGWKLSSVLGAKYSIAQWAPTIGEHVYASMTGTKYKEVVFLYSVDTKHYCVNLKDFVPERLESGQYIVKLAAFKHIKPLFK